MEGQANAGIHAHSKADSGPTPGRQLCEPRLDTVVLQHTCKLSADSLSEYFKYVVVGFSFMDNFRKHMSGSLISTLLLLFHVLDGICSFLTKLYHHN